VECDVAVEGAFGVGAVFPCEAVVVGTYRYTGGDVDCILFFGTLFDDVYIGDYKVIIP
jgi:hypothetical protein